MRHAMRALGLNLKHWAEDYPVETIVVGVVLAMAAFIGLVFLAHGCETEANALPQMTQMGADSCFPLIRNPQSEIRNAVVGGCGAQRCAVLSDRSMAGQVRTIPRGRKSESGQPPTSFLLRPSVPSFLRPSMSKAVTVPLVEGPYKAPAGAPNVPPFGPGGYIFWRATIHHTATPPARPAERVKNIDADHRARGWDGIGYHFLVAEDGTVFAGRPLDRQGAHVEGRNEGNLGIAFIGTYTARPPPEAALASVRRLLARAFETWGFGAEAVYFHRDLAVTECPGTWDKALLF